LTEAKVLETARGRIVLRPEQSGDADFLYVLFRSHMLAELAMMPVDAATKEQLVRMQFDSQTATYRAQYPHARFDIVEQDGAPIGRLIVDSGGEAGCIVDFALLPEHRGGGLGTAIIAAVLREQCRPVLCTVLYNNEASLRMCRRVGFVQIGGELPFLQLEWRPSDEASCPGHAASSP
jgi:RimJ/RimL family protein N-acetyltransferase